MPLDDIDRRLVKLETSIEATDKWVEAEIDSLRVSRHAHGETLQKHELFIAALQQTVIEVPIMREAIGKLAADARVNAWKIGAIIAALLFAANQLANRIHF